MELWTLQSILVDIKDNMINKNRFELHYRAKIYSEFLFLISHRMKNAKSPYSANIVPNSTETWNSNS